MSTVSKGRRWFAAAAMMVMVSATFSPGLTRESQAQAPLVPMRLPRHSIAPRPTHRGTAVLTGRSVVTAPRFGSSVTRDFLSSLFAPAALGSTASSASGWNSVGPASVLNAQGTIGGNLNVISGRVAAIAVDPTSSSIFYVAAAGGGVWKTTDGGSSYVPLTDFLGDTAMGSIAVAPSNNNIVYAGTGEANNSGDSQYGIGLLKSTDGGASWSLIPGPSGAFYRHAISKIVVSPASSSVVYLTTTDFANNGFYGNTGVWKTTDGGSTWTNVTANAGLDSNQPYTDLVMDPTHPNTLYAAIGTFYGDTANGVYKTTDGGTTWTKLSGFPTTDVGRISLTLAASSPSTLYASVSDSADYSLLGLYKTVNAGATWTRQTAAPNYLGGQGWYDNAIVVSPTNPNAVFAGGQVNYSGSYGSFYALAGSLDGGATFQDYSIGQGYSGPHTDLHALTFTPDGTKLLDGNDGGVWRLENPGVAGGVSTTQWSNLNANLGTIQFTGAALHPTDPTIAYGGSQDNGTEKYTGSTAWSQVRGGDGGFTRVDQTNPNTVYHEYYGISLERSDDGGSTWSGKTTGINPNDPQPLDGSDPAAFYVPFKLDPLNQARVIYGTDHIYESTDHGNNFTAIGIPGTAGFNPSGDISSTLGVAGSTIYAALGTNLYATYNDGTSWTDVTIPSLSGRAGDIYVNPSNAKEVYVSCAAFGGGKVYHSTNGGASWTDITGNLPDEPFNAIVRDPATSTLYAGGDDGVYTSSNGGSTWSRLDPSHNFPTVQVVDLAISPGANLIAAATHGRGLYEIALSAGSSAPTITSFTPTSGSVGTTVTVTGTGFTGATSVVLHGTSAHFTVTSDTKITLTVPTGATTGHIDITTSGGTAVSPHNFTVNASPQLTSLSPTSAYAGGSSLTLTVNGSGFLSGAVVKFGSTALTTTFVSSSQLTATITSALRASVGTYTVTVVNPGSAASNGLTFALKPRLTALTLSASRVSGGQTVTGTVTLNGAAPTGGVSIPLSSSSTARATVPASVTVAAGATTATFPITTLAVTTTGSTTLTANGAGGTLTATLTVLAPVTPTADTFGQDGSAANTNYGTTNPLLVKTATSPGTNRDAYLKFSLGGFTTVTSAKLQVTAYLSGSGSLTTGVYGTSSSWTESGLTWNNKPALGSSLGSFTATTTTNTVYTIDVTAYVQSQLASGSASFGLHNPSASTLVTRLVSRELSTGAAQLVITGN